MSYNYEESDIIDVIYNSYLNNNNWEKELKDLIFEIVIYNDDDNINEIINSYGGIFHLCNLYVSKYKMVFNKIEHKLSYYQLLAYIGIYNKIYTDICEKIICDFSIRI